MRKIFLAVFLLVSLVSFSQEVTSFPTVGLIQFPKTNGIGYRGVGGDSLVWLPSDTIHPAASIVGKAHAAIKNGVLYYWDGSKWAAFSGGGGGSGTVTSVATGYGLSGGTITTTGTLRWDSATGYLTGLRRKDSATGTNLNGYLTRTYLRNNWGIDNTLSVGQVLTANRTIDGDGSYILFLSGLQYLDVDSYINMQGNYIGPGGLSSVYGNFYIGGDLTSTKSVNTSTIAMGLSALHSANGTTDDIAIGTQSLYSNVTGANNVAIGTGALQLNTASNNTAIGWNASKSTTSATNNTAIGYQALANGAGSTNTAVGAFALLGNAGTHTGQLNTAVGANSLKQNTTGEQNVAVGVQSLFANTTGIKNVAVGAGAMEDNTIGGFNVAVGQDALLNNVKGGRNVAIGWEPLRQIADSNGNQNVAIGYLAGDNLVKGDNNIFLGYAAGWDTGQEDTVTNAIVIGAFAQATASNQMILGNSSLTDTRVFGVANGGVAADSVLVITSGNQLKKRNASSFAGGSTPTLQQVLTAGSTLTGDNTIAGGGHALTIDNTSSTTINAVISGTTNSLGANALGAGLVGTNASSVAQLYVSPTSITIEPPLGSITIDTLNSGTKNDSLVVWRKSTGDIKMINAGDLTRQRDTIPLFTFGGGGGQSGDTTTFSTSTIYGSFYNDKSDTLVITKMLIGLQGTSPDVTITVYYNDSLNVTAGATKLVNAGNNATNIYTGTSVTSFDNAKIPPGVWVWCKSTTVATKPTYLTVSLSGYKSRTL